ncbi:MAG TPA: multidrug effflux MFS transporter [Stellaceae bacterium]|nr:multidrug effflux MFS transporter [Stellaceae bacterium]
MAVAAVRAPAASFAVALAAVSLIGPLAIHLYLPVVPDVQAAFAVPPWLAELSFSITLATMAVATLVYGSLSDRFGRRPVLLWGLGLFLGGSALSALAGSITVLIVGRLVQAVGAGCSLTITRAMARDAYGPDRLVKAIAYLTMAYTLGPMLAPPVGGFLADAIGWRSVFGFALLAGGAIALVAFAVLGETRPGSGPSGRSLARDYRALFADARFSAFVLQSGFCSGSFFAIAAASPFLMQDALGRSATEYGFYFFAFPAGYCIGNFVSGRLAGKVAIERMVMLGSLVNAAAIAVQAAIILGGQLSALAIFVPGFFVTFSQGLALPNAQAGAMQTAPELAGTAAGIGVFCQTLASGIFAELYGLLADGTAAPMLEVAGVASGLTLLCGAVPLLRSAAQRP